MGPLRVVIACVTPLVGQVVNLPIARVTNPRHIYLSEAGAMESHTEYLTFKTQQQREYINITDKVATALDKSGIQEGLAFIGAMHITAGVWVNDAEDGIIADIDDMLESLSPTEQNYRHHRTGERNGHAHLKNILVGNQVVIPVTAGRLDFGPWQQIYYCEWDGQRPKRLIIKIIGE